MRCYHLPAILKLAAELWRMLLVKIVRPETLWQL
jgi:hypothetical protein